MHRALVRRVDEPTLVRQTLTDILSSDPAIEVLTTSQNPCMAAGNCATRPGT